MRPYLPVLLFGLALPVTAAAQASCSSTSLPAAAREVASLRRALHRQAIAENDPKVPAAANSQLALFKEALAAAANAVFACAQPSVTAEAVEKTLAEALHANLSPTADTPIEVRGRSELGVYGADLAVQVFPLSTSPRYLQVDFRYGVACGDDNLLLVFRSGDAGPGSPADVGPPDAWHEVLRWGAPAYTDVSGAYGDFILMTPISGFAGKRDWRFAVAHGQPGCGAPNAPSRFDLDVLSPAADPLRPEVVWHLERPYLRSQTPRLSSTEDTLTFELVPPEGGGKAAQAPAKTDTYRYRIGPDHHVVPIPDADAAPASSSASGH